MKKKDFLPIILGSDENAYGTARLFREAYPEVTPLLVCTAQLIPTRHSRLFDCRIIAGFEREEVFPDALLGVLRECSKDYEKLLVIPCSDYYTGLLCRHYDHFEGLIANRFIPEQLLETFDTKDRFYALCEQYGMDYPKTVIAAPDERIEVADRLPFDFPIVVKPENSNALDYLRCHFEGQKKVFFFDTREEYLTMVRSMNGSDYRGKLILQEFIPGGDDACACSTATPTRTERCARCVSASRCSNTTTPRASATTPPSSRAATRCSTIKCSVFCRPSATSASPTST